jgi:hypothetical protein
MSKLLAAFEGLGKAFEAYSAAEEASGLPEQHKPSALLLTYDPLRKPNARCQITGDTELLVQVLLMAVADNEPLREAMVDIIPQLLDHA